MNQPGRPPNKPEAFWRHVEKTDGCWIWIGGTRQAINSNIRYGRFGINNVTWAAHRFSWKLTHGKLARTIQVLHNCDNGLCVNPSHLFVGTHQDNMRDRNEKGRAARNYGNLNGQAKLSAHDIVPIRCLYDSGKTMAEIAHRYSVSRPCISLILSRKNWRHIS